MPRTETAESRVNSEITAVEIPDRFNSLREREESSPGVVWSAVIGGAFVAAALSLILLALGAGFGLSAVSPWSNAGAAASTVGAMAIGWVIFTEIVASSMGGYLAGRLRTKWHRVHNDETHFRDTANGLLVWAVAVVITFAFLGAGAATMAGASSASDRASISDRAPGASVEGATAYFVDSLFRSERLGTEDDSAVRAQAGRVLTHALLSPNPSDSDSAHLVQLVEAKTGLNSADATRRVSETLADARQAEDQARQATAHLLLWIFLALLTGAFAASYAATIGGRQRDHVKLV